MVSLPQVQATNAKVATSLPAGLVAVFAGATSGIGELALKGFVKHAARPRVYFIGRSEEAARRLGAELKASNSGGEYVFLKGDFSLMKNVDAVCKEIKRRERTLNVLFMSQGVLSMKGDTADGLPYITAVGYYSRMRLAANLLPLMQHASSVRHVISTLAGGKEGRLYTDDIMGRKVPLRAARGHLCSAMTLSLEALAQRYPTVAFVHNYPGYVRSNLIRQESGWLIRLAGVYFSVGSRNKWEDGEEVAERHAFLCTAGRYASREGEGANGVALEEGERAAMGTDGEEGSGVYTVDEHGESVKSVVELLGKYRKEGMVEKVWEHVEGEFVRITGSKAV